MPLQSALLALVARAPDDFPRALEAALRAAATALDVERAGYWTIHDDAQGAPELDYIDSGEDEDLTLADCDASEEAEAPAPEPKLNAPQAQPPSQPTQHRLLDRIAADTEERALAASLLPEVGLEELEPSKREALFS